MTQHTEYDGTVTDVRLDDQDERTIIARAAAYDRIPGPRVGDFVEFADGITRRISHVWAADWHEDNIARCQTSDGGSFYLGGIGESMWHRLSGGEGDRGDAYVSFSGSLYESVKADTLKLAGSRNGAVWVFHHEQWGAGRGVNGTMAFRVFTCSEKATR